MQQNPTFSNTAEDNQRITVDTTSSIANEYVKIMNEHYPKTGVYFTESMLNDLSACSSIYNTATSD